MRAQHNERITLKRLCNRHTRLRKRVIKKTKYLTLQKPTIDPRRLERWQRSIARDLKELELVDIWISRAKANGGFIIWFDKRSKA